MVFRHELYYKNLKGKINGNILAVISSVLFGLMHLSNYGFNFVRTIPLMLMGLLFCYMYKKTDNIWTPIVAHILYNGVFSFGAGIFIILLGLFS